MSLERAAWSLTVLACAVTVILLAIAGYWGYAGVFTAVAAAAAINLR